MSLGFKGTHITSSKGGQQHANRCHDLEVAALVKDTIRCVAEGRYCDKDVMMAVVFGTGTNASGEHVINKGEISIPSYFPPHMRNLQHSDRHCQTCWFFRVRCDDK